MMDTYGITFETKCYENDWQFVLKTNYLNRMIRNCGIAFTFKQLIINNVKNRDEIKRYAQKKVEEKIIDAYYFVDDYIDEALHFYAIDKNSFGKGYYYSTSELVGLYVAKTKYLLHFSSDAFMLCPPIHTHDMQNRGSWILEACEIFEKHPVYVVANPLWGFNLEGARAESMDRRMIGNFYIGYGFSDQCYLVRTDDFRQQIYGYTHPASEHYPKYGEELFEKRVDSFMRTKERYRLTSIKTNYIHSNFPKSKGGKIRTLILLKLNLYYYYVLVNEIVYIKKEKIKNKIKNYLPAEIYSFFKKIYKLMVRK
jgi:hypothetical protein